nr:MAG TPA: hypothetical protein [Caudoviricetes sp.]
MISGLIFILPVNLFKIFLSTALIKPVSLTKYLSSKSLIGFHFIIIPPSSLYRYIVS